MTAETIIQKVREKLGSLNANDEQIAMKALKILQSGEATSDAISSEEAFISSNITPEEYEALPRPDRRRYQSEAEKRNHRWIERQFRNLGAKWIMVIDGQVIRHGATLKNFPDYAELLAICDDTGKYPFAFLSPRVFAIEEIPAVWHNTNEPGDAYPALSIVLTKDRNRFETEADLDTGAVDCYASLESLAASGVVEIHQKDIEWSSHHLSEPFDYFAIPVWFELTDDHGISRRCKTTVICVENWQNRPFTAINPTRTFLLGRSVLLELRPRVVLDFEAHSTQVYYPVKAS